MLLRSTLKALAACWIFILVTPVAAKPVVNFIPQRHQNPFVFKEYDESVAASQFEVLRALSRLPNATVFVEGLTKDSTPEKQTQIYSATLRDFITPVTAFYGEDKYFLRKRFAELTQTQKMLLYERGGVWLAVELGMIKKLRATVSEAEHEAQMSQVRADYERIAKLPNADAEIVRYVESQPFQDEIVKGREFEVLKRIQNFVTSTEYKGEELAVVYGGYHQFNSAYKFSDAFEFNHTRACESRVIQMPAPKNYNYMLMPDGSVRVF